MDPSSYSYYTPQSYTQSYLPQYSQQYSQQYTPQYMPQQYNTTAPPATSGFFSMFLIIIIIAALGFSIWFYWDNIKTFLPSSISTPTPSPTPNTPAPNTPSPSPPSPSPSNPPSPSPSNPPASNPPASNPPASNPPAPNPPSPAPINGGWCDWSPWTTVCHDGNFSRSRLCNCPAPQYGGIACDGSSIEYQPCPPPPDGYWGPWTDWSQCVNGKRTRTRECIMQPGAKECDGVGFENDTSGCASTPASSSSGSSSSSGTKSIKVMPCDTSSCSLSSSTIAAYGGTTCNNLSSAFQKGGIAFADPSNVSGIAIYDGTGCSGNQYYIGVSGTNYSPPSGEVSNRITRSSGKIGINNLTGLDTVKSIRLS